MKTVISSRVKKIISIIINSTDVITIRDISNEIEVSRRTVLREMDSVYSWFNEKDKPLERIPNKGILLNVKESERLSLLENLQNELEDYLYTKEERITFILTDLLQNSESSKLFYFADMLNVSEATISHDLDKVDEWLLNYDLTLERKPGVGVKIVGKERDIRKALISIIYDRLDGEQINSILSNYVNVLPGKTKQSSDIKKKLLDLIDYDTIKKIEFAIDQSELDMGFKFAESSYTALAVHLALAIKRIISGDKISIEQEVFDGLMIYEEFHIAKNLINSLGEVLHLHIPEEEIAYVTMHLKGAKYKSGLADSSILEFNEIVISNYKLTSIIYQMIQIAEIETGYKLSKNDSLLIGLVDHLRPAINRLQMKLEIRNPLLDIIKEKYPEIYETALKCCDVLESNIGIKMPDSEIGYIAMHIGSAVEQIKNKNAQKDEKYNIVVTCTSGIGTSKMLAERIRNEFKNISIVEVLSTTKISKDWLQNNNIDLIVSTVHFTNDVVPVTTVNPLLLQNDIDKLLNKLESITLVRPSDISNVKIDRNTKELLQQLNLYSSAIIDILDYFVYRDDIQAQTFEGFLSEVCITVNSDKKKAKLLQKELLKREKFGSIIFSDEQVILLHTRTYTTNKIIVGVFRNEIAIEYDNNKFVAAIVLIAPHEIEHEKLEVVGEISSKLVSDPSFVHKIKKANEHVLQETIEETLSTFFFEHSQKY